VALSVALAALVLPAHRALRPRLDRLFFPEHHRFELGMRQLLEDLARPTGVPVLLAKIGEQLHALMRPESLVIYAREESSFAAVFAEGAVALPPLPVRSPLVAALEGRAAPLAEPSWAEKQQVPLDAFDRAALESLGAALVLPVQRGDSLALFVTLGPKRSGDLYTTTEIALLTALTSRLSEALGRLGEADLLREAHAMQAALRRYVPGAVAERVARGEELSPGTRDVTVLFVDIRGYTRLSEGLAPPEIFSTVSRYTRRVSELVSRHGGSVVEFHGDGLLAVFGAPDALPRKERAAVEAARETLDAVEALAREEGSPPLAVGVGIATGSAYVGNVRAHDREIWTVLGNPTNLAARLQALTRELGASIALDATTHDGAGYVCADFVLRPALEIRGRSGPVDVWSLPIRSAD
jgi:class 3 adenylate cyclase